MDTLSYKTLAIGPDAKKQEWVVVDATDQVLGRLCAKVAKILRGKYKPGYCPYMECGDKVIIINAEKAILTGKKMTDKVYLSYTGYPGGQRETTPARLLAKSYNKHIKKGMHPLYIHVILSFFLAFSVFSLPMPVCRILNILVVIVSL